MNEIINYFEWFLTPAETQIPQITVILPLFVSVLIIILGTIAFIYFKKKNKNILKYFNKKAFAIGTIFSILLIFYVIMNIWGTKGFWSKPLQNVSFIIILITANIITYGTIACIIANLLKKKPKKNKKKKRKILKE